MCFGFTDEVPSTVNELDLMIRDAYLKSAKRDKDIAHIARNFHLNNGAIESQVNQETQNFEYKILTLVIIFY